MQFSSYMIHKKHYVQRSATADGVDLVTHVHATGSTYVVSIACVGLLTDSDGITVVAEAEI